MKNLKEAFGQRLKEIRKSKNYTQEVLAEKIDLSPRQLIRIENGENFPSVATIGKISLVFEVSLAQLFDFNWNDGAMYFSHGIYNKPSIKAIKKGDYYVIKTTLQADQEKLFLQSPLKVVGYEDEIFSLCRRFNKPITIEFFENKKRVSIKTFYPDKKIEEILSKEDIINNDLYDYILTKLKQISSDYAKLNYIKTALDSLDDKEALKQLSGIVKGMDLLN